MTTVTEYRSVDTSTLKGVKEAERLRNAGLETHYVGLFIVEFRRSSVKVTGG